ncbi:hypothetical protein LEMLEM_LOCUS17689, partial [Lemmus lemmus]
MVSIYQPLFGRAYVGHSMGVLTTSFSTYEKRVWIIDSAHITTDSTTAASSPLLMTFEEAGDLSTQDVEAGGKRHE